MNQRKENFEKYVDLTLRIRQLSSPLISDIRNAKEYRKLMMSNFRTIGELSQEKNRILEEDILPLLTSRRKLKKTEIQDLKDLYGKIFDARRMENLDVPLAKRIADRILYDADKKGDEKDIIAALDAKVEISFAAMHILQRLNPVDKTSFYFRDQGLEAAERLLYYLPKPNFRQLPDETSKHIVLVNSRYISSLFDRSDNYNSKINREDIKAMERALALANDPFYRQEAPNYNWRYHELRTLQYITNFVEFGNARGFDSGSLETIYKHTRNMSRLWHSDEELSSASIPEPIMELYSSRIGWLTGRTKEKDYCDLLYQIVMRGTQDSFDIHENMIKLHALAEYLLILGRRELRPEERAGLKTLYDELVQYVHRMPKKGSLSFMLSFLADILKNYRETEGGEEYENFCLRIMAALHPPTYVHTLCVADVADILTESLLEREPERFIGFRGCTSRGAVLEHRQDIMSFVHHAALLHDIGKLFVAEIITTYGRKLFEAENRLIGIHPLIGANVLAMHEGTREYANIAKFHHVAFDEKEGYPLEAISALPEKTIIHIVSCADCLDAGTDSVGRSYKEGKTITQMIGELKAGSGNLYAPYVVDLLKDKEVLARIKKTLQNGRDVNYQKTYELLAR